MSLSAKVFISWGFVVVESQFIQEDTQSFGMLTYGLKKHLKVLCLLRVSDGETMSCVLAMTEHS